MDFNSIGVFLVDLVDTKTVNDTDLLIVEDAINTKKIIFRDFRQSLIADAEAPASYRIYSSQKVHDLITELNATVDKGIGSVDNDIAQLEKNKVSQNDMKSALDAMDKKKVDQSDFNRMVDELDNTRKKTDKITGADLAYGSEEDRIHLQHLGSDILDAMTGHTQIAIPSVPVGGWRSEDLANGSISALKLSKDYTYRGTFPEGNLNSLVDAGVYEVAAGVAGVPHYGNDMGETRLLEVIRYGIDGKWIIQRVYYKEYSDETRPSYFERKGLFSRLSILEFVPHYEVTDFNKVEADLLGTHYNNRGVVTSGDLFELELDGNYLCEPEVLHLPTTEKYMVNIRTFGNRKEYEAKKADVTGCITWCCYEYHDNNGALLRTEWINTNNVAKSKFDGATFHIFGDGISYGMGASNISETAYTSILRRKYGYKISNHALADASAGNYGDNIREQSSLLTQIDSATGLSATEEFYVIIFIGAEDFKSGIATIGNDTNYGDSTFKGALNLAIEKLYHRSPYCKILLVTPMYRASIKPGDSLDSDDNFVNNKYLREFVDAMVDIGKRNHIPCLNLYDECSINKYNSGIYLSTEGIYPSDKGHALLAEKIHNGMCRFY